MVWCSSFPEDYSADRSGSRAFPTSSFRPPRAAARGRSRHLRSAADPVERTQENHGEPTTGETAFVLSGGASLGAVQAGMLRALYERGIVPDLICGTSVGALNGAFVAAREQTMATAEALGDVWRGLERRDVFPLSPLAGLMGLAGRRDALVSERSLERLIHEHVGVETFRETRLPLHLTATDVPDGLEVRLSEGDLADAVLASTAIPGVFPTVEWHGHELMDGGVADNTPLSHAIELGATEVYVLATGGPCVLPEPPRGAVPRIVNALAVLVRRRLVTEIDALGDAARLIVLPPPCPLDVSPNNFARAGELIERALDAAREHLGPAQRRRAGAPARRRAPSQP